MLGFTVILTVGSRPGRKMNLSRSSALLLVVALSTSCVITYRDFPTAMVNKPPKAKPYGTLYYEIDSLSSWFGGGDAVREAFRRNAPFERTEIATRPPSRGFFCRVDVEKRSPSIASVVGAYASYVFLFALPFWSTRDGYYLRYHLFVDGKERKIFEYDITRKAAFWIGLLPVTWVNFFTYSEQDAFEASTYQFFADAAPYFERSE